MRAKEKESRSAILPYGDTRSGTVSDLCAPEDRLKRKKIVSYTLHLFFDCLTFISCVSSTSEVDTYNILLPFIRIRFEVFLHFEIKI